MRYFIEVKALAKIGWEGCVVGAVHLAGPRHLGELLKPLCGSSPIGMTPTLLGAPTCPRCLAIFRKQGRVVED